jgi:hypothetical protein
MGRWSSGAGRGAGLQGGGSIPDRGAAKTTGVGPSRSLAVRGPARSLHCEESYRMTSWQLRNWPKNSCIEVESADSLRR